MPEVTSSTHADRDRFQMLYKALAPIAAEFDGSGVLIHSQGDVSAVLGLKRPEVEGLLIANLIYGQDLPLWELAKHRLLKVKHVGPFPLRLNPELCTKSAFDVHLTRGAHKGHILIAFTPYQGTLSLGESKRPASRLARQSVKEDFGPLAKRLQGYVAGSEVSIAEALIKLAGVGDGTKDLDAETSLWALYRFLHDAALEHAAAKAVEEKRQFHEAENETPEETSGVRGQNVSQSFQGAYKKEGKETNYVTVAGEDGISESEAVKAAVFAMKEAASAGNAKTIRALTGGYEKRLEAVKSQLRLFKQIVVQERFEVALQPIVTVTGGILHHYEALARFDQTVYKGSPFEFMTFAEKLGVIQEFDLAMTMKVVSLIKRMRRIGYNIAVAVNISGHSIQAPGFLRHFFRVLEDCGDIRKNLMFELTESSQIDDLEATNRILSRIRDFGHKVALDDFGAGAAGLQYLRVLKVDCVKIDGIYIRKAIENAENRSFLRSMAELCSGLNIETVGECVETEDQRAFLEEIGVTYAQGWLYGKALPVDETIKLLSES